MLGGVVETHIGVGLRKGHTGSQTLPIGSVEASLFATHRAPSSSSPRMISADHRTCDPPVQHSPGTPVMPCDAPAHSLQIPTGPSSPCSLPAPEEACLSLSPRPPSDPGSGKTSFLRLFLDTSEISPLATKDQLHSVAKFVQGSSGRTSYIKSASVDIALDLDSGARQRLGLTLIDTPSLDFRDEPSAERLVLEVLRHIDQRFLDGIDDVSARSPSPVLR